MASAEPPAGFRGRAPGQGVRGAKPPEAESILVIGCPTKPANLAPVRENSILCYGPLVSELGGAECMVPPNPVLGGPVSPGSAAYETTRYIYAFLFFFLLRITVFLYGLYTLYRL